MENSNISKELSFEEKIDALRLSNSERIGPVSFHKLVKKFGNCKDALKSIISLYEKKGLRIFSYENAVAEFEKSEKIGARILFWCEKDFPYRLKKLYDCPALIYVIGNTDVFNKKSAGIVGARNASVNSVNFAKNLAKDLSIADVSTISGLAIGIDAAVHTGSLESEKSGSTIAVVAGGVDDIYPMRNREVRKNIIENGGAIVSINLIGAKPKASEFPRRNKIIAGLSGVVAVIEANEKSGSLITAKYAMEQDKFIFAVPSFPGNIAGTGTNMLIKNGARILECASDIMPFIDKPNKNFQDEKIALQKSLFEKEDDFYFNEEMLQDKKLGDADDIKKQILSLLNENPTSAKNIYKKVNADKSDLDMAILELELDGKILEIRKSEYIKIF